MCDEIQFLYQCKPTKKKAPVKADRGKGLNVLLEVALSKSTQLKGDSGEEDDDDEDDYEDKSDDDNNDDDGDYNDDEDKNDDDDDESDNDRTVSDRSKIPNLNQSNKDHEEEEEEYTDDRVHTPENYELTNEEDNVDNTKEENEEEKDDAEELYKDVNVKLRKKDVEMTNADQGGADQHNVSQELGFEQVEEDAHVTLTAVHDTQKTEGPMKSSSFSSDFTDKLLNFENTSPANNEIASLMDTTIHHEEPSSQASSLFTIPITLQKQQPHFLHFQTSHPYSDSTKELPTYRYIGNKQGEAIQQAIKSHTAECREEALADKREYIDLINTSVRAIIKEVKTQLSQILPQAVSEFATRVIERNVTESLEADVLAKSSSQPKSTYEVAASLFEFELMKILIDMMEEHKSYLRADYKRELYDALVKSYNTKKDLFETYGEVFTLKRSRDDKDKDQDPSARSYRGTKIRKSSKDANSYRDPKSKESKLTSSSKGTSRSQHKSFGKSAHTEEPSHTVDDSGVKQNQEFDTGNNDEQPNNEDTSKVDWYKKPEKPPTPDPDWDKRQHVDFRPPQTWISNISRAEKPPTSFDELMDNPINFSAFVMNRLNITNMT
ncbi:hypothetical protein Tco_1317136 [Tanacetum coccineum]